MPHLSICHLAGFAPHVHICPAKDSKLIFWIKCLKYLVFNECTIKVCSISSYIHIYIHTICICYAWNIILSTIYVIYGQKIWTHWWGWQENDELSSLWMTTAGLASILSFSFFYKCFTWFIRLVMYFYVISYTLIIFHV